MNNVMSDSPAMKTIFGYGPSCRNLKHFCAKTTASTTTNFESASLKKERRTNMTIQYLAVLCLSSAMYFGNFMSISGYIEA